MLSVFGMVVGGKIFHIITDFSCRESECSRLGTTTSPCFASFFFIINPLLSPHSLHIKTHPTTLYLMKMGKGMIFGLVLVVIFLTGKWVEAEVHHVVGGDRGWDPNTDLVSWSSGRVFRVGDQIWLTYSVAQGLVAELRSREEYEACDVSNPIKMYTDGLHTIPLEREGIRYFVSSETENCKNGLKLHVEVLPEDTRITNSSPTVAADGPTTPSGSARYGHNSMLMLAVIFGVIIGFAY
ncbi:hypothetical protein VNO77_01821 [Canavalia gladiata]|uniref:Phytocyanin domain-containing protein n=1 Tax=Canavalia gladiata TaxID=3824 RepID=A0AAN9R5K2_CANGL